LQLGCALVAVAVLERRPLHRDLNKSECVDRPIRRDKKVAVVEKGRCGEVAVVVRWPLVEVPLYTYNSTRHTHLV